MIKPTATATSTHTAQRGMLGRDWPVFLPPFEDGNLDLVRFGAGGGGGGSLLTRVMLRPSPHVGHVVHLAGTHHPPRVVCQELPLSRGSQVFPQWLQGPADDDADLSIWSRARVDG